MGLEKVRSHCLDGFPRDLSALRLAWVCRSFLIEFPDFYFLLLEHRSDSYGSLFAEDRH